MAILLKPGKPDNFELYNSLKLSFTNIRGLRLNFVDCECFLEPNSSYNLALCEVNLGNSTETGYLSMRGYLPLIRKDSSTHMHGLADSITCQKLCSCNFLQIANSVLIKRKSASGKQNCLLKTFLKTLILLTQVSLYLFYLLELI